MARFRKIDVRMWRDRKFRALSAPEPNGRSCWQFLLTCPSTSNIPGLYHAYEETLAREIGWPVEGFREALQEVFREGLAKADLKVGLVFIPNAIKYDPPQSPNVVKSWAATWDELPECELKTEAWRHLKAFMEGLSEGFREAFREVCPQPSRNPEPEPEPEPEPDKSPFPASPGPGKPGGIGSTNGEVSKRAKKRRPMADPGCQREVIAAYCDEWVRVCQPADGKSPAIDGADVGAAGILAKRGLVEATELIKRYLADPDPYLARRGHLLRDLPSRLNAYRRTTGPPPAAGAAKGFARAPTERPKESYDATHEL